MNSPDLPLRAGRVSPNARRAALFVGGAGAAEDVATRAGNVAESLVRFIVEASKLELDARLAATVKAGFIDFIATMLAGRDEPVVCIARDFVRARAGVRGYSRVLLEASGKAARSAALVNAIAGHALAYDAVALQGHPCTVLVPALLAEGERLGASGTDVMRAFVVGYEVWAELLRREVAFHHSNAWHATAVFGVVAAAAAVAALRRASPKVCQNALAIAASQAAGLAGNFGAMVQAFHVGLAAAHAIDAVDLAHLGMTACADAIEHPAGFLLALLPAGALEGGSELMGSGSGLHIREHGLCLQKYPVCFAAHRVVDAALALRAAYPIDTNNIRSLRVTIGSTQASLLSHTAPQTVYEARFSLNFAVAAALVAGELGLAQCTDDFIQRPDVQELMRRVEYVATDSISPFEPAWSEYDRLVIELNDDTILDSGEVRVARGMPQLPLNEDELRFKFFDCSSKIDYLDVHKLYEDLQRLESVRDLGQLGQG